MAKGNRRLTTSRSERLLGSYAAGGGGGYSNGHHHEPDLREEDVWSTIHDQDHEDDGSLSEWSSRSGFESNGASTRRPRRSGGGGLSLAFEDSSAAAGNNHNSSPSSEKIQAAATATRIVHQFGGHGAAPRRHVASSAPVNVPDWSKILRIDSVESLHEMSNYGSGGGGLGDHDDDDDSSDEMVPPHEYLAREYARGRKTGGASVFEGVGRTLKGRDLRRVRDAVWSQTGFDG